MKIHLLRVVTALGVVYSASIFAQSPSQDLFYDPVLGVSGNLSLVSDYLFRGETLSDGKPAIQGGLDYKQTKGLFLGAWLSSGDKKSPLEIDIYGGYIYEAAQDVDIIGDLTAYIYPHMSVDDSLEASIATHIHDAQIAYYYDFDLEQHYFELGVEHAFTDMFSSELRAGLLSREDNQKDRPSAAPKPLDEKQIWDVGIQMDYQITGQSQLTGELVYHELEGSSIAIGFTAEFSL